MIAIYKRELKSFFQNITGCLFVAANLLFSGIYFTAYHLSYGYPYVAYTISSVLFILLIATPILTMKSLSEEKSKKTDQLLLTSPVSVVGIVLGKYLAMVSVFAIPVLVMSLYPPFLGMFGEVPYAESYVAIFGYFMFGAYCIAIGLLVSALTENLIIAAIGTFAALMLTYLMGGICSLISKEGNIVTRILSYFDSLTKLNDMMQGTLNFSVVTYFVTMIAFVLFLVYRIIQKRRFSINKKNTKITVVSTASVIIAIGLVVSANYGVSLLPEKYKNVDVTTENLFDISNQTIDVLNKLDEDINIYVLSAEKNYDATVSQTLKRYEDLSRHIKVSYKDTYSNPEFAKKYNASDATGGSLIVEGSKRFKIVDYNQLYITEMNYETYSNEPKAYDAEGQITSAINYVTTDIMPKVYAITGHDEANVSGSVLSLIGKGNVDEEEINLLNFETIPDDADAIIIISPTRDYSQNDVDKVCKYIDEGGKVLMFSSYTEDKLTNFDSIIEKYGLTLFPGMIIESDQDRYYQNPYFLLPQIGSTKGTAETLNQKLYILMPYARPVSFKEDGTGDWSYEKMLSTSDDSFAKKNVSDADNYDMSAEDIAGPFSTGVYMSNINTGAEIVYFSSESLLNDNVDSLVGNANSEMVASSLLNMMDNDSEDLVSVPAKDYALDTIVVSKASAIWAAVVLIAVLPFMFLVNGIIIWVRRRKR